MVWMEFIAQSYAHNIDWHFRVHSIVLFTKSNVTKVLSAMHDINNATENSHVKTNLAHTLHQMRKVGTLEVKNFKDLLTSNEMAAASKQVKDAKDNKISWYNLPRAKFFEYIYSVSTGPHLIACTSL